MKYAVIDGNKVEATKGQVAYCQICKSKLVAKCGEVKMHHWAHKSKVECDHWWENEREWHRDWKNEFPDDWQEIIHQDENGVRHIADIKTEADWVIEFQHSYLSPQERRARNNFYGKIIWVVDGTRRKTDKDQFESILKESSMIIDNPPTVKVNFPEECRLLKEWGGSKALVFFDFNRNSKNSLSNLWFLYPAIPSGNVYMSILNRSSFVSSSLGEGFEKLVRDVITPMQKEIIPMYEKNT